MSLPTSCRSTLPPTSNRRPTLPQSPIRSSMSPSRSIQRRSKRCSMMRQHHGSRLWIRCPTRCLTCCRRVPTQCWHRKRRPPRARGSTLSTAARARRRWVSALALACSDLWTCVASCRGRSPSSNGRRASRPQRGARAHKATSAGDIRAGSTSAPRGATTRRRVAGTGLRSDSPANFGRFGFAGAD